MRFLVLILAIVMGSESEYARAENEIAKIAEMLCNTTFERTVYEDGSQRDEFRSGKSPIRSAKITIRDVKKFDEFLFVDFASPYLDETKKFMGMSELENETFTIKFNVHYQKSDFDKRGFRAHLGDALTMVYLNEKISIVRQSENRISYIFMECREF